MNAVPSIIQCVEGIESKHILIDTCFVVDNMIAQDHHEIAHGELVRQLRSQGNTIVTIYPVYSEFFKGTNTIGDMKVKKAFFDDLVSHLLPIDSLTVENMRKLIQLYRTDGKKNSTTDFVLGACLMRYADLLLLTRDHNDFPSKIFERLAVVPVQLEKGGVDTYSIVKYSEVRAEKIMDELLNIEERRLISR